MEQDENDLDNIFEEYEAGGGSDHEEAGGNNDGDTNAANDTQNAERVPPPKRIVKNPRLKFNAERLCGERGIPVIMKHFKDVKFKGKGHEVEDLNKLLSSLEHWCHRLYPSMKFGDCLRQIEKLGKKRPVQTCVRKIRLDMPILFNDIVPDERDEEQDEMDIDIPPQDAFDQLINEIQTTTSAQLSSTPLPTKAPEQRLGTSFGGALTDEQRKRMEYNKLLATERRKAKLEAMQSNAANSTDQSQDLFSRTQLPATRSETSRDQETNTGENSSIASSNFERVNRISDTEVLSSGSQICEPISVVRENTEELGLDDLIDLVDEEEDPEIVTGGNGKELSLSTNSMSIRRNDRPIEVVNLAEREGENWSLQSIRHVEVVDLRGENVKSSARNTHVEIVDLDCEKSKNLASQNNGNVELIDIDNDDMSQLATEIFEKDVNSSTSGFLQVDLSKSPGPQICEPMSVVRENTEELGLDDLIDFVDEEEDTQIIAGGNEKELSLSSNSISIRRNDRSIEVVNVDERELGNYSLQSSRHVEVVDLRDENVKSPSINKQVEIKNLASQNNGNVELIDIDNDDMSQLATEIFEKDVNSSTSNESKVIIVNSQSIDVCID